MTTTPESVSLRELREILAAFQRSGWTGMTLDLHGVRIAAGKNGPPAPAAGGAGEGAGVPTPPAAGAGVPVEAATTPVPAAPPPVPTTGPDVGVEGCVAVRSPAVGTLWVAPGPGQPAFVEIGQVVAQDQQLAIVEVMKLMNPVVAAVAGEVARVDARNAEMVEYDQVLFWIRPA